MTRPQIPANERERLLALRNYKILDTQPEDDFDAIARLAAAICHTPVSIVGFIDESRHWFKSSVGIGSLTESSREISFCGHLIAQEAELLLVPDTLEDERFVDNPLVIQAPHVRFYAGVPLLSPDGLAVGTLCVLDVVPHGLDDAQGEALKQLAQQVLVLLRLRRTIARLRVFESAVAGASDAILITELSDPENHELPSNILFANKAFERMTGYDRDELVGRSPVMFDDSEIMTSVLGASLAAINHREQRTAEVTRYRKNGRAFPVEVSVAPVLDDEGACTHWISIARDVTQRKSAEAALIRAQVVQAANETLTSEIAQRRTAEERLTFAAFHDDLTGLPNRAFFVQRLEQRLATARDTKRYGFAVLFIDLDRFKRVNDSFGHLVGDELLTLVAKRLQASLRPGDTLARFEGDEFTVLVDPIEDASSAAHVADRLMRTLEAPFKVCGREAFIRSSVGITVIDRAYTNADDVLRDADIAMYHAKETGRDRYQLFYGALRDRALGRAELETDLRLALEREEFMLVYQPVIALDRGHITGLRHSYAGVIQTAELSVPAISFRSPRRAG